MYVEILILWRKTIKGKNIVKELVVLRLEKLSESRSVCENLNIMMKKQVKAAICVEILVLWKKAKKGMTNNKKINYVAIGKTRTM